MIEPAYADVIALLGEDEVARAAALIRLVPYLGVEPPGCDSSLCSSPMRPHQSSWRYWGPCRCQPLSVAVQHMALALGTLATPEAQAELQHRRWQTEPAPAPVPGSDE